VPSSLGSEALSERPEDPSGCNCGHRIIPAAQYVLHSLSYENLQVPPEALELECGPWANFSPTPLRMQKTTGRLSGSGTGRILRILCFLLAKLLNDWLDNRKADQNTEWAGRPGLRIDGREFSSPSGWHVQLRKVAAERTGVQDHFNRRSANATRHMSTGAGGQLIYAEHLPDGLKHDDLCYAASTRRFRGVNKLW
jgi:hypothetical protein